MPSIFFCRLPATAIKLGFISTCFEICTRSPVLLCRCLCLHVFLDELTHTSNALNGSSAAASQWAQIFSLTYLPVRVETERVVECLDTLRVEAHSLLSEPLVALSSRLDSKYIWSIVRTHVMLHRSNFVSKLSSEFISSSKSLGAHIL